VLKKVLAVCLVIILSLGATQLVLPLLAETELKNKIMANVPEGTPEPDITIFVIPAVKLMVDKVDSVAVLWQEPPSSSWPLEKLNLLWPHAHMSKIPQTEGDFYGETDIASIGSIFDQGIGPFSKIETSCADGKIMIAGAMELQGKIQTVKINALPGVDAKGDLVLEPQKMVTVEEDLNDTLRDKIKDILTFTLVADFLPGRLAVDHVEISAEGKLQLWGRYVPNTPLATE